MLLFKAGIDYSSGAGKPREDSGDKCLFNRNGCQVTVMKSGIYDFCFEQDDKILAGESIIPVNPESLSELAKNPDNIENTGNPLGNDIFGLCIIDTVGKRATFINSISSCRPYYYTFHNKEFICSTSLKKMRELGVPIALDEAILPEYFAYRVVAPPRTFCRNVSKVVGGELLKVDFSGCRVIGRKYWHGEAGSKAGSSKSGNPEKVDSIILSHMGKCFKIYDNRPILLSGGNDSSLLAAMAKSLNGNVNSASTGFSFINKDDMEEEYATSAANQIGTRHELYRPDVEKYLAGVVDSIYSAEEPIDHLQSVLLHLLFTNQPFGDNPMLICGIGADGLVGNDHHIFYYNNRKIINLLRMTGMHTVYRLFYSFLNVDHYRLRNLAYRFDDDTSLNEHFIWNVGQFTDFSLVDEAFGYQADNILGARKELMSNYHQEPLMDKITIMNIIVRSSLAMAIWMKLAENAGSRMYYPFVIPELINFVEYVPWEEKLRENKYLIRSLLRKYGIPEDLITRSKKSFGFPVEYWAPPGTLFQPICDMAAEMYDPKTLKSLQSTERGRAMLYWNILNIYIWQKLFVQGIEPDDLAGEIIDRHRKYRKSGD